MEDIQQQLDEARQKMYEAKELKNKYVNAQKFELAADSRDEEVKYMRLVEKLESQLK